jgi:hypothetical protein
VHACAAELEKNMTKVMDESGKAFATEFGKGTKLGNYIEKNPTKAAFFALMTGMMFTRMMKSRGVNPFVETDPETKTGETAKPKMSAKAKAA